MKKIIKLSYFLFVSLAIVSCSKDDDNDAEIFSNTIEYDGSTYDVTTSYIEDYGGFNGFEDNYYNYDFTLNGTLSDGTTIEFYAELFSIGETSFSTGTFQYHSYHDETEYPDFYYDDAEIEIYSDSYYSYSYSVVSGDIIVTKNSGDNSYSISGVLTLSNDEVVTVSYSGAFEYEDESQITKSSIKSNKLFKK